MPVIEKFTPRELGPKPWGTELLIAETATYIGKVMWMRKGSGGPLQFHERKDETFYLLHGEALVRFHNADGELCERPMFAGEAYHVPPGAVHQVLALQDCTFIEASNAVFNDRVAVEGVPI